MEISHKVYPRASFPPAKAWELAETDGSGKKKMTEEISLGVGLKMQRSKYFQFHVVHLVGRWWMPAV